MEVLKLLAIIAAFVLAAATITTIVLIIFIFKDNKLGEPDNIQENLAQTGEIDEIDATQKDKNTEIKKCKSCDRLILCNLNDFKANENTLIDKNKL